MVKQHLSLPFEFVCATDNASGLDKDIRPAPLETGLINLGNAFPKLAAFRPDAELFFGKRICVVDIDAVICGNLDGLLSDQTDFIIWRDVLAARDPRRFKYNTSLFVMNAGCRSKVWETFRAAESKRIIKNEGRCGSDQAWVSYCLGDEKIFTQHDGVLSWRFDVKGKRVPADARIVFFHGREKPWHMGDYHLARLLEGTLFAFERATHKGGN